MKKYTLIVIVFLCSVLLYAEILYATTDTWTQQSNFGWIGTAEQGTARVDAVAFSIGDKGYLGTGYDGSNQKDFWAYDPVNDIWTQMADFGGPEGAGRQAAVGFSMGDKGYLGTGYDGSLCTKDFWEFDPGANTWTQKADFGGAARYAAVGFSIGNKGYIGTGYDNSTLYKDLWEYDPLLDSWTSKADMPSIGILFKAERHSAVGFSIGDKGYIGLGKGKTFLGATFYFQDFNEYDPVADTWLNKASLPENPLYDAVGFSIGNKGYVGTGYSFYESSLHYSKKFWEYVPATNSWVSRADFGGTAGSARRAAAGFSIGNKSYIGTGSDGSMFLKDFWEYEAGQELLYGHFATNGIWQWNGSGWSQVTPDNPENMAASGSNLYGDFGGNGIWQWNGSGWSQLTADNPENMAASGSNFYGDFGGNGIWQWNGSSWSQLTADNPEVMLASGSNLYGDFGGNGIWQWNGSSWSRLTADNPEAIAAAGTSLYADFGGSGVWKWDTSSWSQLTADNPEVMLASGSNLYGDFGSNGIWQWNGSSWSQLTPDDPSIIAAAGSNVYGAFAGNGVWQWNGSNWSRLTPDNASVMVAGY